MLNKKLTMIVGPDSLTKENIEEYYQIAEMKVNGQRAIAGTRICGIKSRTAFNPGDSKKIGLDYSIFEKNLEILAKGGSLKELLVPPSVRVTEKIVKDTNMIVAAEIDSPLMQVYQYIGRVPTGKLMLWNPAVNQLGWQVQQMATFAKENGWIVGLKHGKWIGEHKHVADAHDFDSKTNIEKVWEGLVSYAKGAKETILIHRGFDIPDKGKFRSLPAHNLAKRVKKATGLKMYFDPSHSYGPKLRDCIVSEMIEIMKIKLDKENYLYDGALIEAGTSPHCDAEQHITLTELQELCYQLSEFRELVSP